MQLSDRVAGEVFVEQGSVYNPGWHITICKRERHFQVLASGFDSEEEALESLEWFQD